MDLSKLSAEDKEFLRSADEYAELVETRGWKRLLDELSRDADVALGKLRDCRSSDANLQAGLAAEWRRQELFLKELHIKTYGVIDSRDAFVRQLAEASKTSEQDILGELLQEELNAG